jgi:hypothetical protein
MIAQLLTLVPWYYRVAALAALAASLVGYGFAKGLEYAEVFASAERAKVIAAAHEQNVRTAERIGAQKAITEVLSDGHEKETRRLRGERDLALIRMRDAEHRARVVPAVSAAPGRPDGEICYDAEKLDAGIRGSLERFLARAAGVAGRGDEALGLALLCSRWLNAQLKKETP